MGGGRGQTRDIPTVSRRIARLAEMLREIAKVPCGTDATAAVWWRWTGHSARLGASRVSGLTATWRDAWRRKALQAIHHVSVDSGGQRLNHGHRTFGKRRWGDAAQTNSRRCHMRTAVAQGRARSRLMDNMGASCSSRQVPQLYRPLRTRASSSPDSASLLQPRAMHSASSTGVKEGRKDKGLGRDPEGLPRVIRISVRCLHKPRQAPIGTKSQ